MGFINLAPDVTDLVGQSGRLFPFYYAAQSDARRVAETTPIAFPPTVHDAAEERLELVPAD